jgi:hypothetical protein
MEYLYKIQHKPTGLYSTGGLSPKFKKKGKFWDKSGLAKHLTMVQQFIETCKYRKTNFKNNPKYKEIAKYTECRVVKFIINDPIEDDEMNYKFQSIVFRII